MAGPLTGIKVVDFSRVLAGPLCARTLADLGADVIKIEPPMPDVSRSSVPNVEGMSGYYAQQNVGKKNISVDLNVAGARDVVLEICDFADIIIENFRAGTLASFGLDYESIRGRNPRVIYASITGYGQGGPWASRMAYAPTVQGEAGYTHNTLRHFGIPETDGRTDPLSHADVYSGMQATIAILAALQRRERTGEGQYIDVAMAAALLNANERTHVDVDELDDGIEPVVLGATSGSFFDGPDGLTFVTAQSLVGSLSFPSYLRAMRRADLALDPRFATAAARRQNVKALHSIVQKWILTFRDIESLDAQLDEAKIAMGQIRSIQQLASTEWAAYWGAFQKVSDRRGGFYTIPGHPWHFSADVLDPPSPPAYRGEHNREVLTALGFSQDRIRDCVDRGILVEGVPISSEPVGSKAT